VDKRFTRKRLVSVVVLAKRSNNCSQNCSEYFPECSLLRYPISAPRPLLGGSLTVDIINIILSNLSDECLLYKRLIFHRRVSHLSRASCYITTQRRPVKKCIIIIKQNLLSFSFYKAPMATPELLILNANSLTGKPHIFVT